MISVTMDKISKVILYKDDEVLLQLRDNRPDIDYPNTWSIIGGYIDEGETAEQAMIREIEEEIGLKIDHVELFTSKITVEDEGGDEFEENIFSAVLPCDISELQANEGREIRMFKVSELDNINIRRVFRDAIKDFFKSKI